MNMFWDIMLYFGYPISIGLVVLGAIVSANCQRTFAKYSKQLAANGMTGAMAAQRILSAYGVNDVTIQHISGNLTDNYSPKDKTLNLSDSVYASSSIAAVGVAAHECGHAIQHHVGFLPNKIRALLVPAANIGSKFGLSIAMIGVILTGYLSYSDNGSSRLGLTLLNIGIIMYAACVLFYLVTLPVELDASRRALKILKNDGLLAGSEMGGARKVLSAAAMTYIASAASALVMLLRLIAISKRRD